MISRFAALIAFFFCSIGLPVSGQTNTGASVQDSIDKLNDFAWSIARVFPDSALSLAQEAAWKSKDASNYPKGLMNANLLMGILNKDRGFYELSVEHYLIALSIAEKTPDSLRISGCLNNLGSVCMAQENFEKALDYFKRSLAIEQKLGKDKAQLSIRLFNIGDVYEHLDSLDKAFAFFYNSLLIEEELKNTEGIFYARLGIGKVNTRLSNFAKAKDELTRALSFAEELKNHFGICETRLALGNMYLMEGALKDCELQFSLALEEAIEFKYKSLQMQAQFGLSNFHRKKGEYPEAMRALESYYALREELNSASVNNRIAELQARYKLEKKDIEISSLKENELVQAAQLRYERRVLAYMGVMVTTVVIVILYNGWQVRKGRRKQA